MRFRSKFENHYNFLILFHSSRKQLKIIFTFKFDYFDWLSQFYSEWRKTQKLVNFLVFCFGPCMGFRSKLWQWLKLLNSFPFIKKTLVNHVYIGIWSFWLTFTALPWMKPTSKLFNLKISDKARGYDFRQNFKINKTSYFCWLHQENTCKSGLRSNLIILKDFHSSKVYEEKLQN